VKTPDPKTCKHSWKYVARSGVYRPPMSKKEVNKMYRELFGKDAKKRLKEDQERREKPYVEFRCKKCGERVQRLMTKEERNSFRTVERGQSSTNIHKIIHEFQDKFQRHGRSIFDKVLALAKETNVPYNHDYCPCLLTPTNAKFLRKAKRLLAKDKSLSMETYGKAAVVTTKGDFPKQGYELLKPLSEWAKRKKGVIDIHTDDAWFSGSSVYLIPHEDKYDYMGTTMLSVPQHSGPPAEMFLYPYHAEELLKALKKVVALGRKKRPKPPWKKFDIDPKYDVRNGPKKGH